MAITKETIEDKIEVVGDFKQIRLYLTSDAARDLTILEMHASHMPRFCAHTGTETFKEKLSSLE